jgi:hypothetical protein
MPTSCPQFRVVIHWPVDFDLLHGSHVLCGLCELAADGFLSLQMVKQADNSARLLGDGTTIPLQVEHARHPGSRTICIDLRDRCDSFSSLSLEASDVYFKRCFDPSELARIPKAYHQKVRPFGLNYPCRSHCATRFFLRAAWLQLQSRLLAAHNRTGDNSYRATLARVKQYFGSPLAQDFECVPASSLENAIIFQTRLWEQHETEPDSSAEVNNFRAEVIRLLRHTFGSQFVGGATPTALARRDYHHVVTTEDTRRDKFIAHSKRFLIGVYTRGLHHSLAFKLAEYLAGSKCIVAEPFCLQLPVPLVAGRHYLPFCTPEECVRQCAELLRNPDYAAQMRRANYEYYRAEVQPAAHLRNCLERAFE